MIETKKKKNSQNDRNWSSSVKESYRVKGRSPIDLELPQIKKK